MDTKNVPIEKLTEIFNKGYKCLVKINKKFNGEKNVKMWGIKVENYDKTHIIKGNFWEVITYFLLHSINEKKFELECKSLIYYCYDPVEYLMKFDIPYSCREIDEIKQLEETDLSKEIKLFGTAIYSYAFQRLDIPIKIFPLHPISNN